MGTTTDASIEPTVRAAFPAAPAIALADRDDTADELHGLTIADPYRYLEDPDAERTVAFVGAQNAASAPYLAALPAAPYFARTVTELLTRPRSGTPWERGGRYFRMDNPGDADQDRLLTAASLAELIESPTVLLDPNTLAGDGTVALLGATTSPDGMLMAIELAEAGSDWCTITVLNCSDGSALADRLEWTKFVGATWLPDSSGVLYWRYPAPSGQEFAQEFVSELPAGELALHLLGTDQAEDTVVWSRSGDPAGADWMVFPEFSSDGCWLLLTASPGTDSRTVVEARRVTGGSAAFGDPVVVVADLADPHWPVEVLDDVLYLRTEAGAERGRLVTIDLPALSTGAVAPEEFVEVIAEHPQDLLVSVHPLAAAFLVVTSQDTAHRGQLVGIDGGHIADIQLPYPASLAAAHGRTESTELFLGWTSFTRRLLVQRVELTAEGVAVQEIPSGPADSVGVDIVAERRRGTSADGTEVPMTVVRRADLPAEVPAPTLLYGYGGFDIPMLPSFSALFSAWVQAGGIFVVANLRGGGEFGQRWHRAGMRRDKQRVFDDLYGCAEALIDDGTTTAAQLAVHGRSNGGLLVGAAITQRPELWAAALPTVGVMDMLRFHLFTIGRAWTAEYGNPDDADDFDAILAYSPLHNLTDGSSYPPTLICTGDHDDRVVPAHSLKFGAGLQRSQAGDGPVLLRIDTRAGHGMGKPVRALAAEYADQLSFAAAYTGLNPPQLIATCQSVRTGAPPANSAMSSGRITRSG
ncbi:MAG: prolyl oligopeptidase family serine peptidase [Actinomycetota bacterium]|nr:prolyl oligopeptidase family serine peptidase [Actinomycetota bacterium]